MCGSRLQEEFCKLSQHQGEVWLEKAISKMHLVNFSIVLEQTPQVIGQSGILSLKSCFSPLKPSHTLT